MNFVRDCNVYPIAETRVDYGEMNRYLEDEGYKYRYGEHPFVPRNSDAQQLAEFAGRLCYLSFDSRRPGGTKEYLRHILDSGHGSVLEHCSWSFLVTGVSRSLTHELVRHRAGFAYSQLSQRYVDESAGDYVVPPEIDGVEFLEADWKRWIGEAHDHYVAAVSHLLDKQLIARFPGRAAYERRDVFKLLPAEERTAVRKAVRQAARSLLPNATETKVVVTGNARAWRHFIEQRGSAFADPEIRRLARAVWKQLFVSAPDLFGDYGWFLDDADRPLRVHTPFRKV